MPSNMTRAYDSLGRPIYDITIGATLDFSFDWSNWFDNDGDFITSATVTADPGMTLDSQGYVGGVVTGWVTAGMTAGMSFALTCTINTFQGRADTRTLVLLTVQR